MPFAFLFLFLFSCSQSKKEFRMPRIPVDYVIAGVLDVDRKGQTDAFYEPLYFGRCDTPEIYPDFGLYLDSRLWRQVSDTTIRRDEEVVADFDRKIVSRDMPLHLPVATGLGLYVDTAQYFLGEARHWSRQDKMQIWHPFEAVVRPAALVNHSADSLAIWIDNDNLPLLLEAKDKEGKWKAIEILNRGRERQLEYEYTNRTIWYYPLPPDEMILTAVPILSGEFETKLRLCYRCDSVRIYSNEFMGKVNPEQFGQEEE